MRDEKNHKKSVTPQVMAEQKTITIPLEKYLELVERDLFLSRLEESGVDNWEWYHLALKDDEDEGS